VTPLRLATGVDVAKDAPSVGKIVALVRHGKHPNAQNLSSGWENAVLNARMSIGETELMGAGIPPDRFQPMRSAYLTLLLDSDQEAERICALLSDGGQGFMPMEASFFASRFAMLRDRFGTSRMILHERSSWVERAGLPQSPVTG
jgi:PhnB protein